VCSEYLDEYGVPVDLEPETPRMENLVEEASRKGPGILERKRRYSDPVTERQSDAKGVPATSLLLSVSPSLVSSSVFMKACRRESVPYTPIWLMPPGRALHEGIP